MAKMVSSLVSFCKCKGAGNLFPLALLFLPFLTYLFAVEYLPGMDESWQLEAAVNLSLGRGYVASWKISQDIAVLNFDYLTAWPIGYSLLLSILLYCGLPLSISAKLIKLICLVVATCGWLRLAVKLNGHSSSHLIFAPFLVFFLIASSGSASDLFLLMIFPYLIGLITQSMHDEAGNISVVKLFGFGFLAGATVVFKYTAIPIVVFAVAAVFIILRSSARRFSGGVVFFAPVSLIVGGVFLLNFFLARSFSTITDKPIEKTSTGIRFEWALDAIQGFFLDGFYLPKMAVRALAELFSAQSELCLRVAFSMLLAVVFLIWLSRKWRCGGLGKFLRFMLMAGAFNFAFLWLATNLFFPDSAWNPLQEGRYYQWLIPGFVIAFISGLKCHFDDGVPGRSVAVACARLGYLFCFFLISFYSYHAYSTSKYALREAGEAFIFLKNASQGSHLVVVADRDNFRASPLRGQVNVYADLLDELPGKYASRETVVGLVCARSGSWRRYIRDDSCDRLKYNKYAEVKSFSRADIGERTTVFWKRIPAGQVL